MKFKPLTKSQAKRIKAADAQGAKGSVLTVFIAFKPVMIYKRLKIAIPDTAPAFTAWALIWQHISTLAILFQPAFRKPAMVANGAFKSLRVDYRHEAIVHGN